MAEKRRDLNWIKCRLYSVSLEIVGEQVEWLVLHLPIFELKVVFHSQKNYWFRFIFFLKIDVVNFCFVFVDSNNKFSTRRSLGVSESEV